MLEYFIHGIVLHKEDLGEMDNLIHIYTKELGKVTAKVKSTRKITSKLSAHLEPLSVVAARLVKRPDQSLSGNGGRNGFQIVDALSDGKIPTNLLFLMRYIKELTFDGAPDYDLWSTVWNIAKSDTRDEKKVLRLILKILGYGPEYAECHACNKKEIKYFSKVDHVFFCDGCASRIMPDELLLI